MLNPAHVPTPLVAAAGRAPVEIAPPPTPPRFPTLAVFTRIARWLLVVLALRLTGRGTPAAYGRHLRLLLEDFGGLWVKLGQLLSLRVDVFPLAFARELGIDELAPGAVLGEQDLELLARAIVEAFRAFLGVGRLVRRPV